MCVSTTEQLTREFAHARALPVITGAPAIWAALYICSVVESVRIECELCRGGGGGAV